MSAPVLAIDVGGTKLAAGVVRRDGALLSSAAIPSEPREDAEGLYRTLLECTPFLKNDERIPVWQNMYEEQIAGLNGQDIQRIIDRAGVRKED